jgi:hypothetical protein
MGSSRSAPGGNTQISRRVVFSPAASLAIGSCNRVAHRAGVPGIRFTAPYEEITQKTS